MAFENQVIGSMGTLIYVADIPDTVSTNTQLANIPENDWKLVGGVTDGGTYGGTYELGSEAQLHDGNMMKWKGVKNPGSASLSVLVLQGDEGQEKLIEYADLRQPIAVRYVIGKPSTDGLLSTAKLVDYFAALVMGWDTQVGSANDAITASPTLELIAPAHRVTNT